MPIRIRSTEYTCVLTTILYVNRDYFAVIYQSNYLKCIFGVINTNVCQAITDSEQFHPQWHEIFNQLCDDSVLSCDVSEDGKLLLALTNSHDIMVNFNISTSIQKC